MKRLDFILLPMGRQQRFSWVAGEGSNRGREEDRKTERETDKFGKVNLVDMEELRCREAGIRLLY